VKPILTALREARHVVVFTGAGVSAESGLATFRDALTGLWSRFDPTRLATAEAFEANPELVWGWYEWRRLRVAKAEPNAAHVAIAALEAKVPKATVVTQNVDDLHERAGTRAPIRLHGSLFAPRCFVCHSAYGALADPPADFEDGRPLSPPRCPACSGPIRPGVVWFGEALPEEAMRRAFEAARDCDLLLTVGTSGAVYPAADIPREARRNGATIVEVNPNPTDLDDIADFRLRGPAAEILPRLLSDAF
jgi:NAD-dependent protein deacetylase/lipoamidase